LIKLIVVDLDGTVVKHDFTISPHVIDALRRARDAGVRVTIATGRGPDSTRPFAEAIGVNAPVICTQGAQVVDLDTNTVLQRHTLSAATARHLIGFDPRETRAHTVLYIHDQIHVRGIKFAPEYYKKWFVPQTPHISPQLTDALAKGPADKVLFVIDPADGDAFARDLTGYAGANAFVARTHALFVEANPPGADKGSGLAFLANHLGIAQDEVMAIGDQGNDLPMLRWAGLPVAMGNGSDEARALARWVAPDVDHDGVTAAVNRFVFNTP
jgi:Cof subfamily protein (haloacid dehalogenase superfamily)